MKVKWEEQNLIDDTDMPFVRRITCGQNMSCMQVVTSRPGMLDLTPHYHENEQWVMITAGTNRFVCDDEKYDLHAGDVALIPSGHPHTAVSVGDDGATFLQISAPARLDLIADTLVPSAMKFGPEEDA